jgi:2'-5' RNA ligase
MLVHDVFFGVQTGVDSVMDGRFPDAAAAEQIHRRAAILRRAHNLRGRLIEPERLHVSLFFLGGLPEKSLGTAYDAAADVRVEPFEISFDRSVSFRGQPGSRPFVLVGDDGLRQLGAFRRMLSAAMTRRGLRRRANTSFTPHVTLLYGIMAQTPQAL